MPPACGRVTDYARLAGAHSADGERLMREMGWAGHEIIRERVSTYAIDDDLKWGYLDVAIKPRLCTGDLAVCDPNFVLEYFRLSADKRLLFGRALQLLRQ